MQARKAFFFEKKKQKTFVPCAADAIAAYPEEFASLPRAQGTKVFWSFFSKKDCLLLLLLTAAAPTPDRVAIEQVLQDSAVDWSRNDLAAFMRSYEDSPTTQFVTRDGLLQGYAAIQAHYAAHYPAGSGHAMGHLTFETIGYRQLAADAALVTGRYALARPAADGGAAAGIFTLLFHHSAAGWRIAYDHTS